MERHTVTARWLGNRAFEGIVTGHKVIVDIKPEKGGDDLGPSPKQLMLLALAGCTGTDVAAIVSKMKLDMHSLNVTVEGDLTDEHPRYYKTMHVVYEFTGRDLPLEKLQRAVDLSEEKYCGVRAVYVRAMNITSEIRIVPA